MILAMLVYFGLDISAFHFSLARFLSCLLLPLPVGVCGPFKYEIYSSHSGLMFGNGQQITLKAPQQQQREQHRERDEGIENLS